MIAVTLPRSRESATMTESHPAVGLQGFATGCRIENRTTYRIQECMALIDDPQAWILLMFQKEEREGRGEHCQRFPDGCVPERLDIADGELVYGIYKNKYYFSPTALYVADHNAIRRLPWAEIQSCTTHHGDGNKTSTLTLRDGVTHDIRMSDLVTGWNGRISQLIHQMIERYGFKPVFGRPLMAINDFFAYAVDDYSLFPNLEPHPTLHDLRESFARIIDVNGVSDVRIVVADDDPVTGIGVAIQTSLDASELATWASSLGSDGIIDASDEIKHPFNPVPDGERVLHAVWD